MSSVVLPVPYPLASPPRPRPQHLRVVERDEQVLRAPIPLPVPLAIHAENLPSLPYRVIGKLAVFAFEAVEGTRSVGHLSSWISAAVARELSEFRALNIERRSLYRDTRRVVPTVHRIRVAQPSPGVAEAAVVLNTASRAKAVALRFEGVRGNWQATSITVL